MGEPGTSGWGGEPRPRAAERDWRSRDVLGLLLPALAGLALRLAGVRGQVLTGDELHTLNGALALDVAEILRTWTYHGADYSVPLTAGVRLLLDAGVVIDELWLRLVPLVTGVAAVVLVPLAWAPRSGRRAAWTLAWLIALAPMWVLYSRIVRSYMPVLLLSALALAGFERFWRDGRRGGAVLYAAAGAAAVHFHLGAAPLLAAAPATAWALAALRWARGPRTTAAPSSRADWWRPLTSGVALAVTTALLLLPARHSLVELVGLHGRGELPPPAALWDVLLLQAGTSHALVLLAALATVGRGGFLLARREPELLAWLVGVSVLHVVGLAVLAPNHLEAPVVASRYLLVLQPAALLLAAVGLATPLSSRGVGPGRSGLRAALQRGQPLLIGAALAIWVATGPLLRSEYRTGSFAHTSAAIDYSGAGNRVREAELPPFYAALVRDELPGGTLLEFPWVNIATHAFEAYQKWHGQEVAVASLNRLHRDARVHLRNTVDPAPPAVLASRARWLVLHRDLWREEAAVATRDRDQPARLAQRELWQLMRRAAANEEARLRAEWGPPHHEDPWIVAWDLAAVRRAAAHGVPAPSDSM